MEVLADRNKGFAYLARKIKAASILQQFEAEMGIAAPPASTGTTAPTVGHRVGQKSGS